MYNTADVVSRAVCRVRKTDDSPTVRGQLTVGV